MNKCKVAPDIVHMIDLHIMPPGVPLSTAVDNGGDRSCTVLRALPIYTTPGAAVSFNLLRLVVAVRNQEGNCYTETN